MSFFAPFAPPFIVAEISGNHCGSIGNAIRLIKAAKRSGADAVKTQCYDPDAMTLNIQKPDFIAQDGLWRGRTLYELYEKAHTPPHWHPELYRAAKQEGILIFSSVFDLRGLEVLEGLDCPIYKIASFEITDTPLIKEVAMTGKPIIISTGMATMDEVADAVEAAQDAKNCTLLHCTSEYPASIRNAYLSRMATLKNAFPKAMIGISDHTAGFEVPIAATVLGAEVIEKHLKLSSIGVKSEDDAFSLMPLAFTEMVKVLRDVHAGMTNEAQHQPSRQFRRSLYAVADIKKGEKFTKENIRAIRPGYGLPPKHLYNLLGKESQRNWRKGDPLS